MRIDSKVLSTLLLVAVLLIGLDGMVAAVDCSDAPDESTCLLCAGDGWYWKGLSWPPGLLGVCRKCPEVAFCSDYHADLTCNRDPCEAAGGGHCYWDSDRIACLSVCELIMTEPQCLAMRGCWWKPSVLSPFNCRDCPFQATCGDYTDQEGCLEDPCGFINPEEVRCWWCDIPGDGWDCIADRDFDLVVDTVDNCPDDYNPMQENRYCDEDAPYPENCDKEGDACDDTDYDGLYDAEEDTNHDGNLDEGETSPMDMDTDDNCISDGLEKGFDPIINVLTAIGASLGVLFFVMAGLKWILAETPEEKDNAKRMLVYIVVGLLLIAGGTGLVMFILTDKCPGETPQVGYPCDCPPETMSCISGATGSW